MFTTIPFAPSEILAQQWFLKILILAAAHINILCVVSYTCKFRPNLPDSFRSTTIDWKTLKTQVWYRLYSFSNPKFNALKVSYPLKVFNHSDKTFMIKSGWPLRISSAFRYRKSLFSRIDRETSFQHPDFMEIFPGFVINIIRCLSKKTHYFLDNSPRSFRLHYKIDLCIVFFLIELCTRFTFRQ